MRFRLSDVEPSPDVFAAVMATGILSVSAEDHHHRWISDGLAVVTWLAATLWIPPLLYATVRHFRWRFTGAWWAMVFPLGMYSAATFAMLTATGWSPFRVVSLAFFWIALAAWVVVAIAAVVVAIRRAQAR